MKSAKVIIFCTVKSRAKYLIAPSTEDTAFVRALSVLFHEPTTIYNNTTPTSSNTSYLVSD